MDLRTVDWAGFGTTLAVAVVLAYVLVGGDWRRMEAAALERITIDEEMYRLSQVSTTVQEGERAVMELREQIDALNRQLPASLQFGDFYSLLTSLAREHEVDIVSIQPGAITKEPDYVMTPVTVEASSNLQEFYQFLAELRSLPRLNKIEELSIQSAGGPKSCTVSLVLNIYAAP